MKWRNSNFGLVKECCKKFEIGFFACVLLHFLVCLNLFIYSCILFMSYVVQILFICFVFISVLTGVLLGQSF
jgi:hypothetical protein